MADAISGDPSTQPSSGGFGRAIPSTRAMLGLLLLAAAAVGGMWTSYHFARWQWHIEGDIAGPYMFWTQIVRDGLSAIRDWRYAQDNWLFSLIIPDMLVFSTVGPQPWFVMMQGWGMFLASCFAFFLLISPVAGRWVAGAMAVLLLFAGPAVVGGGGGLTYPVTHNISLLWGLYGLVCVMRWVRAGGYGWLALGSFASLVGIVSDPWLAATLALPIALGAAVTFVLHRERRRALFQVAVSAGLVLVLARSRMLGLLWFLPGSDFQLGTLAEMQRNLGWVATYIGVYFNIVPIAQRDIDWMPPMAVVVVNCVVVAVAMAWAIVRVWRRRHDMSADAFFLAVTAALGCGGMAVAFLISNTQPSLNVGRYLSNWYYLLPALMACAVFGPRGMVSRVAGGLAVVWAVLFVTATLAALPSQLTSVPEDIAPPYVRALIKFLDENGLTYGYAPFWSTNAAAVQWLTDGRIVVRPVSRSTSGHIVPRIAQTFPAWFEPGDAPKGQKSFFLLAAPDDELCVDAANCEAMGRRDFGTPDRVLNFQGSPVLVWDRPFLTGLPPDELIAAVPPLEPNKAAEFHVGAPGVSLLWRGWSGPEWNGSWTMARQAVIMVHLPDDWTGDAVLEFMAYSFPLPHNKFNTVTFSADGQTLGTWSVGPWQHFPLRIPAKLAETKRFALVLDISDAVRPSDFRYIYDIRSLGVFFQEMVLRKP